MDNQQVKTHLDIGWLAGLIDGEGSITIVLRKRSIKERGNRMDKLIPYISITNTNKVIIDNAIRIAQENKLPFYQSKHSYIGGRDRQEEKIVYRIVAEGLGRCDKWLDFINKHLVGKKYVGECLSEFIKRRHETINIHPSMKPYTPDELELYKVIVSFNNKGTIGRIPQRLHVEHSKE